MTVNEFLATGKKLLFDGSMGTYYSTLYGAALPEVAMFSHPERIVAIHREYIAAGANAIKTNSFASNSNIKPCEIAKKAWEVANEAVKDSKAFVFADIGCSYNNVDEYIAIADCFLELGATNFLFETQPDITRPLAAAAYIKSKSPDAFIIVSVAAQPDGFTRTGESATLLLSTLDADKHIDVLGLNCISGPAHLLMLINSLPPFKKPLSVMPNSGYPSIVGGRTYFPDGAEYFAAQLSKIAKTAQIVGGCCGTTPEYIALVANFLPSHTSTKPVVAAAAPICDRPYGGTFLEKLKNGKKVVAVELDPPEDADITRFMSGAQYLKDLGVDAVTIADCPVARVRADSSMLAAKLRREMGLYTIPHMTCRDRNINASKALLLGLGIEGVEGVLVVTGDPVPDTNRDEIKAVFSYNSAIFARYIKLLGVQTGKCFAVGGALNVNAPNFAAELKKAERKVASGVDFFLTQPIFTEQAAENLRIAKETLNSYILGGIIPIVSYRNALFMKNEMSGIDIPDDIVQQYKDLDREAAEALAIEISVNTAVKIATYCDGYYLITPFARVGIIGKIVENIRRM